jgi:DNA topoisomerase VI subunit A
MREHLDDPREGEYFSEKGLTSLTGLPQTWWSLVILKELIDNSLDAIEGLKDKCISIDYADKTFFIHDTYGGIPENVIESIHDFSKYASNKRHYIAVSRGYQGNALKTVIGICHLMNAHLEFITSSKKISYKVDESKLAIGIVRFKRVVEILNGGEDRPGIRIRGIRFFRSYIKEKIQAYHLCNPDVSFVYNGSEFSNSKVTPSKKSGKKMDYNFIHWYDLKSFNKLLQAIAHKDPDRTTKMFCSVFSKTQRILSSLEFPHKKLSDFADNKEDVSLLYEKLKDIVPQPSPDYLKKNYLIGRARLKNAFGNGYAFKYKSVCGEFRHHEVDIPFYLELSLHRSHHYSDADIVAAINRSVPYESCPFKFNDKEIEFHGKKYKEESLLSILDQAGFKEASGARLFIHLISPYIEFTDQSKTHLVAVHFKNMLIEMIEPLTSDVIKEVEKARKAGKKNTKKNRTGNTKDPSKKDLMKKYFMEGYEIASEGYKVAVRQIFYTVRNIVNIKYQIDLKQSDYNSTFTQEIATNFIERYPELEDKILFERRGYFYNPVTGDELPLGTKDVLAYIKRSINNGIYRTTKTFYSIPDELMFKQVLFVEKAGFNIILKESGLIDRLNLGVMSTQGFGTRAVKRLMKYFLDKGIKVYVLHDCDIPGYLICDKFLSGSNTYKEGLDVIKIGLSLDDAKKLGKDRDEYAETIKYKRSYKKAIKTLNLSMDEKKFLIVDGEAKIYRRAELNTLTSPELISFIESKITRKPIAPTVEQLRDYISMDKTEIVKNALYAVYASHTPDIFIDKEEIANRIQGAISDKKHWTSVLDDILRKYTEEKVQELSKLIRDKL